MVPIQLLFKAAPTPQSWFPDLLHKAVPQNRSPNLLIVESCSEQLLSLSPKVVSESGFPKFLSPKLLFKIATENHIQKKFPMPTIFATPTTPATLNTLATPAAPAARPAPATIAAYATPAARRYRQMPHLSHKMKGDITKSHAGHANNRGDNGAKRDPTAPPEPAQHYKCRALPRKTYVIILKRAASA